MKFFSFAGFALLLIGSNIHAADSSQPYPNKPIRLVLPFPTGGSTDLMARGMAQKLTETTGKQIVVDNRGGGAGGISGTDLVAKATPDGYVLLFTISISHTAGISLYENIPFDPVRDFTPVTMTAFAPLIMVVHPLVQAKTVQDLIALAKAKPGQINYASGGSGGSGHLAAELFKMLAGINMVHVPYKGGGPALVGAIAGEAQMLLLSVVASLPHVKSGKLRALGITSRNRSSDLPEIPTIAESGIPGYEVNLWYGVFGPKGMPREVVNYLNREIIKVVHMPEVKERLALDGAQPSGNTPDAFAAINKAEVEKWAKVIKAAGIKAD